MQILPPFPSIEPPSALHYSGIFDYIKAEYAKEKKYPERVGDGWRDPRDVLSLELFIFLMYGNERPRDRPSSMVPILSPFGCIFRP